MPRDGNRRSAIFVGGLTVITLALPTPASGTGGNNRCSGGLFPDLQTVVPKHLSVQNQQQREILRFSNGIANRGAGDWRLRPDPPLGTATFTNAVQEILDQPAGEGNIVCEEITSTFAFHEEHNHWHVGDVALFEVRHADDTGFGGDMGGVVTNDRGESQSIKTTFCLIDWYKLDDNARTSERVYWDCATSYQGIQPGWVDQYHQSTVGQQIDITGLAVGTYYLQSTANPDGVFMESDLTNNSAWTSFSLTRDSKGNTKITEISNSPCDTPGMCGAQSVNR
jgi:hypothetical protein